MGPYHVTSPFYGGYILRIKFTIKVLKRSRSRELLELHDTRNRTRNENKILHDLLIITVNVK